MSAIWIDRNHRCSGGNLIHFEDQEGSQRILLSSPTQSSFVRIGSHNDPDDEQPPTYKPDSQLTGDRLANWEWAESPDGLKLFSAGPLTIKAAYSFEIILGNKNEITVGVLTDNVLIERHITTIGFFTEIDAALHARYGPEIHELKGSVKHAAAEREQTIANLTDMVVNHVQAIGTLKQAVEANTTTIGEHDQTILAHTRTIGEHTETIEGHTRTIGEHTETILAHTRTIGEHTETIEGHTRTIGEHTETILAHTKTIGELEETAGEVNQMQGTVNKLSTEMSFICGVLDIA